MKFNNLKASIILSLSLIGLIVLLFLSLTLKETKNITEQKDNFHFANPNNIDFYETAYKFKKKKINFKNKNAIGGIIPHHLLAADLIAEFFSNLENFDYETIVLIGPNHFLAGDADIITSAYNWKTPYGTLEYDNKILNQLLKFNGVKIEENIFQNEHSINSEVAFIKKTFPNAKFLPIVVKPNVGKNKAEELAKYLFKIVDHKKTLILASVDFSHYKDSITAQKNDIISIDAIKNLSFNKIYDLDIDSPASIYTLLKFSELSKANFEILNNTNSAILVNKLDINSTTSYVTGYFIANPNFVDNFLPNTTNKPIKMLFFGDMMLDRHVGEKIDKYGLDYIFEKLVNSTEENFLTGYDLIGCNLEGAVTNNGSHYSPVMAYDFAFAPKLINELKKYNFNFFNLANNHFSDQGERGIIETRENLDKMDFDYVGCRDALVAECSSKILKIADKKIGMVGFSMVYNEFNIVEAEKIINNLVSLTDFIVVNIHWGNEYQHNQNKLQKQVAYKLIDAGVDVVIGHHPHVIQGIEIYKNKPIFYSLGNFIFDQYFSNDTQNGLAIEIKDCCRKQEYLIYPIKSEVSQVKLMLGDERKELLNKLSEWSEVNSEIKEKIKKGQIEL